MYTLARAIILLGEECLGAVDWDGSVADATMVKAINPAYDRLLMDTAKNWRFHPARLGDEAVRYRLTYSIVMPAARR